MGPIQKQMIPAIIYVEDHAGDALLLQDALAQLGRLAQLLIFENGDKALHYITIKESARDLPPPHCIVLDTHVSLITGAQLLRYIRGNQVYDETSIYIFSAEAPYTNALSSAIVSPDSYISKPRTWDGFLQLATVLMRSADPTPHHTTSGSIDGKPAIPADWSLRRQDTNQQRQRATQGSNRLTHTPP